MHKNKILVGAGAKPTGHQVRDFLIREIALTVEPLADKYAKILGKRIRKLSIKIQHQDGAHAITSEMSNVVLEINNGTRKVLEYVVAHEVAHLNT